METNSRFYFGISSQSNSMLDEGVTSLQKENPVDNKKKSSPLARSIIWWKANIKGDSTAKILQEAFNGEKDLKVAEKEYQTIGIFQDRNLSARKILLKSAIALESKTHPSLNVESETNKLDKLLMALEWIENEKNEDISTLGRLLLGKQEFLLTDEERQKLHKFYNQSNNISPESIKELNRSFLAYRKALENLTDKDARHMTSPESNLIKTQRIFIQKLNEIKTQIEGKEGSFLS